MDLERGSNQGYFFVNFCDERSARRAVHSLDGYTTLGSRKCYITTDYADWQGQLAYIARCRQKVEGGEAHHILSMHVGTIPFNARRERVSLEDWLGVPLSNDLHGLTAAAAADERSPLYGHSLWASDMYR